MRRSLIVLGAAVLVLILSFAALFTAGGVGNPSESANFSALPTTTTTKPAPTTTTIITLKGLGSSDKRVTLDVVTVPNVVGMTLAQAGPQLSAIGLSYEISTLQRNPSGTSSTGAISGQAPAPGSKVESGTVIQLTVSGY